MNPLFSMNYNPINDLFFINQKPGEIYRDNGDKFPDTFDRFINPLKSGWHHHQCNFPPLDFEMFHQAILMITCVQYFIRPFRPVHSNRFDFGMLPNFRLGICTSYIV